MPTALQDEIALALRDYIVDGDSGSGAYSPAIPDLRDILDGMAIGEQWITEIETFLNAANAAAARTGVGLGTGDSPTFTGLTLSGGLTVDTNTLKVDNTNNRVGVGTATPAVGLDVAVAASFASTVDVAGTLSTTGDVDLGTSTVFIDSQTGRVGIGTLSPATALDVASGGVWVKEASSSTAFKVTQTGSGIVALFEDSESTDGSPFAILTDGRAVQGYTAAIAGASGVTPQFQVHSTGGETGYSATRWSSDANGSTLYLNKSRGSAVNSRGGLSINDTIATISIGGDDGTNFIPSVQILGQVDTTPGTNDMGGRFVVKTTPDGSATPSERLRIDSTGFISIGGDVDTGIAYPGTNEMAFWSGGAEAMRLEESGCLVVGHTNALTSYTGTPRQQVVGSSNATAQFGIFRTSDDTASPLLSLVKTRGSAGSQTTVASGDGIGSIVFTGYDGTQVTRGGQILVEVDDTVSNGVVPGRMRFYTATTGGTLTERLRIESDGDVRPGVDDAQDLGTSSFRWDDVYATTGTIQTSDAREKEWLGALSHEESAVAREILTGLGSYKWLKSIAAKGDKARRHFGTTSQFVENAFRQGGLDAADYGVWCKDAIEGGGDRQSLRTEQLALFLIADIGARLAALEAA